MAFSRPRSYRETDLSYGSLMVSLIQLWREFGELRLAAVTQALLFGAFTAFWSILALHLQEPRFGQGAEVAGLFGIVGAVGILVAPLAGRFADKHGPQKVILAGTILTVISWAIFGLWSSIVGLAVGCILLDFAVQSVLVSNQYIVYALRPVARARLNTIFMGSMFLGGAGGAAAATAAWGAGGWNAVSILGIALAVIASILQIGAARNVR